jgi:hypothetical protein
MTEVVDGQEPGKVALEDVMGEEADEVTDLSDR